MNTPLHRQVATFQNPFLLNLQTGIGSYTDGFQNVFCSLLIKLLFPPSQPTLIYQIFSQFRQDEVGTPTSFLQFFTHH